MIRDIYHADDSPAAVAAFNARSEQRPHLTVPPMTPADHQVVPPYFTNKKATP